MYSTLRSRLRFRRNRSFPLFLNFSSFKSHFSPINLFSSFDTASAGSIGFFSNLINNTKSIDNTFESPDSINEESLDLTERAVKQLIHIASQENNPRLLLRVLTESGGCHGYQNTFSLTEEIHPDDRIFEKNGARVVIDRISLDLINGSKIDYVSELIGASFKVIDNPLAKSICGCEVSFDIKTPKKKQKL
ncbi:uncharacterized protein T551_01360 [Pneumocystis jirovecii RU7]|uniref:Core domain-containing protein n=1 Tax=Pneumocystis jirovecii (strain RU7) TaxID=1408657 RepID=A0A0W4ZSD9_PNEJ7|nr:uncharacterized protein T551_01360 [Pneumocystis jirovecii RU7]KTW31288.1 hypothetical protein T551_01360 [Pneumocystis jirovecii RU7]